MIIYSLIEIEYIVLFVPSGPTYEYIYVMFVTVCTSECCIAGVRTTLREYADLYDYAAEKIAQNYTTTSTGQLYHPMVTGQSYLFLTLC